MGRVKQYGGPRFSCFCEMAGNRVENSLQDTTFSTGTVIEIVHSVNSMRFNKTVLHNI